MSNRLMFAAVAALVCTAAHNARAAEWGTIKGKFVYSGEAKNAPIQLTKDVAFCQMHNPVDETIVVGKGKELQNVFVYLVVARGKKVEIHPDFTAGELKPKVLDNKGCRFEPHAMTLWTEEPFEVHNSDAGLAHNTNATTLVDNPGFNEIVPNDKPLVKKFSKSEPRVAKVQCSIHPWMVSYLLIRDNPYMAVTGPDGSFEIKNVPAGKQSFGFWHEAAGYMKNLAVGKEKTDRRKGEMALTIAAGETLDLGEIKVAPEILGQ